MNTAPSRSDGRRRGPDLLDVSLLARLERLQVLTRKRLAGGLAGEHRSPHHGTSLDFADFRDYHPGDDIRRLNLGALARLDRLLITLFDAEDDLNLRLLIDTSASMAGPKLERAVELGAAIGFCALVRRDVVSVHSFPHTRVGPRFRGRGQAVAFFEALAELEAGGPTSLVAAADDILARPGPPGLTIVISDLLTSDWERGLSRLPARRGEFGVIHMLSPADLDPAADPDLSGDMELVDAESGAKVEVSLSEAVLEDYRRLAQRWVDDVADRTRAGGGTYLQVSTEDDLEHTLVGRAREAGVLR